MSGSKHLPIEDMELFRRYVEVADWVWDEVEGWSNLAQDTVGKQLIRAADSVGANLVEGDGRYSDPDAIRFFVIGRASAREARYWLNRAARRKLISRETADAKIEELVSSTQLLNRVINYRRGRREKAPTVREERPAYEADAFSEDAPYLDH